MSSQNQIQAVIFDLGGVIVRTEDRQPREALAQRFGKTYAELDQIVFDNELSRAAERGDASFEEAWAQAASALNMPKEEIPAFIKQFFAGDRVDFDLVEYIAGLRPRFKTAALSNTWVEDLPTWLWERFRMPPTTFDVVISSAQSKVRKPDPRIFQMALDMLNVRAEQAVFVDDFIQNIHAAQALGLHTVHFRSAEQARQELTELLEAKE